MKFIQMLLMLAVTVGIVTAQTGTVNLQGTVTDSSGANLQGATVTATNIETNQIRSVITNEDGRYTVSNLPPGTYDLQATHSQFNTVLRKNQVFYVGQTVSIDFLLSVAQANEKVVVDAAPPVVDTVQSTLATVIEPTQMDQLPTFNRSFTDLASLSPGVTVVSGTGPGSGVQIGNAQSYQTGFVLDGTTIEGIVAGGQAVLVAQDWIQEFSVTTSQAPAEFGGASAGVVNAVTRSGSNAFKGRAYGYFQDSSMNANPWVLPPAVATKLPYSQQRIGGMLGGPIRKDKLFFFAGYEWLRNLTTETVSIPAAFIGSASSNGTFPFLTTQHLGMGKLDYHINSNNTLSLRVDTQATNALNTNVGAATPTGAIRTVGNSTNNYTRDASFTLAWTDIFTSNLVNDARIEYLRIGTTGICNYASITGAALGNPVGGWAQLSYPQVVIGCAPNTGPQNNPLVGFYDGLSYAKGKHQMKFGGQIVDSGIASATRNNQDGQFTFPAVAGQSVPFNPANSATFPTAYLVGYAPPPVGQVWKVVTPVYGLFAQDSWRVTPGLTLNGGVRYDYDTSLSAIDKYTPTGFHHLNTEKDEISPRAGFAWTPWRNHQSTVIRGGAGMYFDMNHDVLVGVYMTNTAATIKPGGAVFNVNATRPTLNPYCTGLAACPANLQNALKEVMAYALANQTLPSIPLNGGTISIGGTNYTLPALPYVPGTTTPAPTGSAYDFDSNMRVPYNIQESIGIGQDFGHGVNVSADYVVIQGHDQTVLRNINLNPTTLAPVNPAYQSLSSFGDGGWFTSNSLRLRVVYHDRRGDSLQGAYTYGYSNSNGSFGLSSRATQATDPFNYSIDNGPSSNDIHHILTISGNGKLPFGIVLSPLFTFNSGLPYTATTTASTVAGCLSYYTKCYPVGYTSDSLRGDSTYNLNARLSKDVHLGESRRLRVFFEAYSLTNHSNFTTYQANVTASTFETPTAAGAKRQLQIGASFDF